MSIQNNVLLIGRLTKDPELKFTAGTGIAVSTFTLAVDKNFKKEDGTREADFIPIVCWRKLAEHVANNLQKGRLVAVSGSISTRNYQAQDGTKRYVTEIMADEVKFLDWPKDKTASQGYGSSDDYMGFTPVGREDEIPF